MMAYGKAPKGAGYGKAAPGGPYKRPRQPAAMEPTHSTKPDRAGADEAAGPFYVQGKKASDLEARVYRVLKRLGWTDENIEFQTPILGGRNPGGAMLDFVVWTPGMPVIIEPNGDIWHTNSTAQRERDKLREAKIRQAWSKPFKYVVLPQGDIPDDDTAFSRLAREVGRS